MAAADTALDVEAGENAFAPSSRGLGWAGLGFAAKGERDILRDVAGLARAGEMLFIMGPSGAAKTATLDALARRVRRPVRGRVWLDGTPASSNRFRHAVKYVQQRDHLFEVLSARETLVYAAEFQQADRARRAAAVDNALARLGLREAADTKVGGTFFRGLSGGQQRRVAIGVELVADPKVLLLDEPTSGLDSSAALQVVTLLRDIARSGVAVICTIHQPSEKVFELSDKLLLLSKGSTMYFGPSNAAPGYFTKRGAVLPPNTSIPEFLLDEINTDFQASPEVHVRYVDEWIKSDEAAVLQSELDGWVQDGSPSDIPATSEKTGTERVAYKRNFLEQTILHASRNAKDAMRNPSVVYLRAAMYVALVIMIGIAWLRIPARADRIQDLLGALFFACAFTIFMSISVLPVYLNEREIITSERLNGSYGAASYILGHFVVEAIMLGVLSLVLTAILYPMVNLHPDVGRGFFFALALWVSLLVAESVMILIAAIVPLFIVGIAIGAFLFGMFMVVQGFFTRVEFIPWPLRWIQYIGFHTYSFAAMCINEFDGRIYAAAPDSFPSFPNPVDGKTVIDSLNFPLNNKWANIGIMVAMLVVYRVLANLWISLFHKGKR